MKILHYKTAFLNKSETFIARPIAHRERHDAIAATIDQRQYEDLIPIYTPLSLGASTLTNTWQVKFNRAPSFIHQVIDKERPSLIHAHFGIDGYRLRNLPATTGVPLAVSFYGHDVSRLPQELGWKYRYKRLAKIDATFIAPSVAMRSDLVDLGFPEERVEIVKFGLDLSDFDYKPRSVAGSSLMLVGRLVEKKGHRDAIEAVHRLALRGLRCTLDCYGDGPLLESLQRLCVRMNVRRQVRFHGHVPPERVREELHRHDMLLVPSVTAADGDREGMPNTILEGLACGIPTVASRHAGIPEIILHDHTGQLVEEREPEQLAAAIKRYTETPALVQAVTKQGRRFVEQEHDIRSVVRTLESVYDHAALSATS